MDYSKYSKLLLVSKTLFGFDDPLSIIPDQSWFGFTPKQITEHVYTIMLENMSGLDRYVFRNNPWDLFESYACGYNEDKHMNATNLSNKYKLIGVSGRKQHGKDTVADFLHRKYGYIPMAFAESVKKICAILFDLSYDQLYGDLKEVPSDKLFGFTPRELFQYIGTNIFRSHMKSLFETIHDDLWVYIIERKIDSIVKKYPNACFVISDVRFHNEASMISRKDGLILRVKRDKKNNNVSNLQNRINNHISETSVDALAVDYDIDNNGTLDELYNFVDTIFKQ